MAHQSIVPDVRAAIAAQDLHDEPEGNVPSYGSSSEPIHDFTVLTSRTCGTGLPVTRFVELINLSRAAFYLLVRDEQVPTLSTVASMLSTLGFEDIAVAAPSEVGPAGDARSDLRATKDAITYDFVWPWDTSARRKALEKFMTTAGVAMATGAGLSALALGTRVLPMPVGLVAGAVAAEVWTKSRQRAANGNARATRRTKRQLVEQLTRMAESMPKEQLEALLEALEQIRRPSSTESREGTTRETRHR